MGLDNIWEAPEGQSLPKVAFEPTDRLHVWVLRDGSTAFRGKVYAPIVEAFTGVNLYEPLTNAEVRYVAASLEEEVAHLADLARMFRAYGDAGYMLLASC